MTASGTSAPIRASEALRKKLARIGLHREADLLVHLPLRYEDETRITQVARAPWGEPVQVEVVVDPARCSSGRAGRWSCERTTRAAS